jgi:serine protease inhibitor
VGESPEGRGTIEPVLSDIAENEASFSSKGPRLISFVADHPFIFLIRERETGSILFLGRVVDPSA